MMMGEVLPSRGLSNHAVDAAGTKGVGGIEEVRGKGCFFSQNSLLYSNDV